MAGNQRQKQAKDIERSKKDLGDLLKYAREIHIRPITGTKYILQDARKAPDL